MAKYKLIWASSTVFRCSNCSVWILRFPDFMGYPFDKGYQCERCGCTSVRLSVGRPYGTKSKALAEFQKEWDEDEDFWIKWVSGMEFYDTIKTIPPLEAIHEHHE